jgi:hypothetical protein
MAQVFKQSVVYMGRALQATARWESLKIIKLLLAHDAEVNSVGGKYGTALYAAKRAAAYHALDCELYKSAQEIKKLLLRYGTSAVLAELHALSGGASLGACIILACHAELAY